MCLHENPVRFEVQVQQRGSHAADVAVCSLDWHGMVPRLYGVFTLG